MLNSIPVFHYKQQINQKIMESPRLESLKQEIKSNSKSLIEDYKIFGNRDVKHCRILNKESSKNYSQMYEKDPYSQQQNFLYKRAMFGLNVYDKQELKVMHVQKRKRIQNTHTKTQNFLNLWKQELLNEKTNKFFQLLFPKGLFTKTLVEGTFTDPAFKNTISFKDLGVTKQMIINKLINEGLLPNNFYKL